jgi:drug/metabolite transporter (DMT)-like permease
MNADLKNKTECFENLNMRRLHLAAYLSLCLIWGSTWLAIRVCVFYVPPFLAAALRFLIGAAALLVWAALRRSRRPETTQQWNAILVLGFTTISIPYGLLFWAEQYVTSSLSAVLYSALPLTVALLTPLMLRRSVPRQAVFGMVVAFGGLLVLFTDLQFGTRAFWAAIAVLLSMFGGAWSAVYAKLRLDHVDPIVSTALQLLVGSLGLFWCTWALEPHQHASWTRSAVLCLLFLGTFGSAAAFAVYYWLLQRMQPYRLSTINLIIPIVAVLEGALLGREAIPPVMIVAMVVVLGSVGVVLWAESSRDERRLSISA